jgi:hypothetical protein
MLSRSPGDYSNKVFITIFQLNQQFNEVNFSAFEWLHSLEGMNSYDVWRLRFIKLTRDTTIQNLAHFFKELRKYLAYCGLIVTAVVDLP